MFEASVVELAHYMPVLDVAKHVQENDMRI
jgi:hypothetical protein